MGPLKHDEVTASALVIPDTAKEKPQQGEVMAVGPGRLDDNGKRMPMNIQVGDRTLYAKYTGTEVKLDGEEYIVLNEKDVLAKIIVSGPARRARGARHPRPGEEQPMTAKQLLFDEADRTGARITHDPEALASALEKLHQGAMLRPMEVNPAAAHLFIVNPLAGLRGANLSNLFSTHPPIDERVRRLREMALRGGY